MNDRALFNVAASSLIIASTMVGCSGAALSGRVDGGAGKIEQMAAAQALDAEKAIRQGEAGKAVEIAEAAVAADPRKAAYRTLLGRAYLMSGRYGSAQTAFEDALTLGSADVRTIVNLALVHTAQGRAEQARTLLRDRANMLPAADYGLAMAMSGDADEAIRVLSQAIHDPAATVRERQNLAYSYALAGHWTEARQMATVDLPPLEAAKRVMGWAQTARPGAESLRVIAMIGVQPRGDDAGLPVRLALAPESAPVPAMIAPVQMAEAVAPEVPAEPFDLRMAGPAEVGTPVNDDGKAALVAAVEQQELGTAPVEPAAVPAPFVRPKPAPLLKVKIPQSQPAFFTRGRARTPVDPAQGSAWVVQLGAFSTQHAAQASRAGYLKRNAALGGLPFIDSSITLDGRKYFRVAVAGFGDRASADKLCAGIKAAGGSCFVRMGGPEAAPAKWAQALKAARPQRLAMR